MVFMKRLGKLALILGTAIACSAAHATVYDYSYQFSTGQTITGSFQGTDNAVQITNISNVTGHIDAFGAFAAYQFHDLLPGSYSYAGNVSQILPAGAVVSFDGLTSNFFFTNVLTDASDPTANWFYVIPYQSNGPASNATQARLDGNAYIDFNNGNYHPELFSVVAQRQTAPGSVPEPASIALLGLGAALLFAARRKSA